MKKRNGFTLVELLAVVVVLAIILAIAIPRVLKMIETSRKKAFNISEVMMIKATRDYVALGNVELPTVMEGEVEVTYEQLKKANKINPIFDPKNSEECDGIVVITMVGVNKYTYHPGLVCDNYESVLDGEPPLIVIDGDNPLILATGATYIDPGVTITDNYDDETELQEALVVTGDTVDINTIGTYIIRYNVTDIRGNEAIEVTRTVEVTDGEAPVMALVGGSLIGVIKGDSYTDSGVTITDNVDSEETLDENLVLVNPVDINVVGTYTITYNVSDENGNNAIEVTRIVKVFNEVESYTYNGSYQEFEAPISGVYEIILRGAQGGTRTVVGGKGAYTKGKIKLNAEEVIYIYIGGKGSDLVTGGYNGGGNGGNSGDGSYAGGGGSTDIRLTSGTWNDFNSLKSRIMVASGGAGAAAYIGTATGGYGGVLNGYYGKMASGSHTVAKGATELAGGAAASGGQSGGFGYGGNASTGYGSGGGSGFFGGGGGSSSPNSVSSGGGGASYISGSIGYNAITCGSTSGSIVVTSDSVHCSGKVFTRTNSLPNSNSGNGSASITYKEPIEFTSNKYEILKSGYYELEIPITGNYKIELWGAAGGTSSTVGGKGAYVKGEINLTAGETLYAYVGGIGNNKHIGGYNGGGAGGRTFDGAYAGGGGATDIRLTAGTWNNFNSLKSRIMVASGGAGAAYYIGTATGGYGGNLSGQGGRMASGSHTLATGGTQTSGGNGATQGNAGGFGYGGESHYNYGSGGGSGWYGGGSGGVNANAVSSGGGGSSFVSGGTNYKAITSGSTEGSISHESHSNHYSGKVFTSITVTGSNNSGEGKLTITFLD